MAFFEADDVLHARMRTAPGATAPAHFSEVVGAAANAFALADRSISRPMALADEHERVAMAVQRYSGEQWDWTGGKRVRSDLPGLGLLTGGMPLTDRESDLFWTNLQAAIDADPGLLDALPIKSKEELYNRMYGRAQNAQAVRREVESRAGVGTQLFGGMLGEVLAISADPVVAPTFALGAPAAARVGLLRGMAIEAGIGGGSEAIAQVLAQPYRDEAGVERTTGDILMSIGTAAAGGAGLYGLLGLVMRRFGGDVAQQAAEALKASRLAEERPASVSAEQHIRDVNQAIFDLQEGRAVNIAGTGQGDLAQQAVGLDVLAARLRSLDRQGIDTSLLVPNLPRAMEAMNNGVRVALSRRRTDGLVAAAARAQGALREAIEAAAEAERTYQDWLTQQSQNTTDQLAAQMARGGRANAERAMDRSTRQRLNQVEQQLQTVTDPDQRAALNTERRRIVDAARKRVEREAVRLEAEGERIQAQVLAAEARRNAASQAVTRADREFGEAQGAIAREIGGALDDRAIRRMYQERAAGRVEAGDMPVGQAARAAEGRAAAEQVQEQVETSVFDELAEARLGAAREAAQESVEFADQQVAMLGEEMTMAEALERVDIEETNVNEWRACTLGA